MEMMKVLSVSFLQDWDLVSSANNTIAFAEEGDSTIYSGTIAPGNYSIANFPNAVADAMSTAGTQGYTVTYDGVSRKISITATGPKKFKILPASRGTTAYILTGMSRWTETGYYQTVTLKNPVNLSGSYLVLLTSNIQVKGSRYLSDFDDSVQSVVATVVPDSFGDVITWTNDAGEWLPVDDTISKIEFYLIDLMTGLEVALNSPLTVRFAFSDDVADV
ncbi:uncharacterized protein SPPG_07591 [Spizellomyces punctatus DAOM BR117]|uniref:Uncharacterized protein n=1 Tax=Spizellomyces punctatus (strain DAOM BR117) TaxID=645134 RepID=A0A0L0H6S5_SPIPD|nr:uncharacterized protein SPPG_07591 [Spizellomyces punctatus DAOM BR117]KNC97205.1 hypothetical protein SPPG_07591 [Spizellomyces punctatus DAOM BR117]|eukprot:XP_016605245.1 hypothetical protein SPPG_07591 [Spizellomyces punctatus DAOM BR117]